MLPSEAVMRGKIVLSKMSLIYRGLKVSSIQFSGMSCFSAAICCGHQASKYAPLRAMLSRCRLPKSHMATQVRTGTMDESMFCLTKLSVFFSMLLYPRRLTFRPPVPARIKTQFHPEQSANTALSGMELPQKQGSARPEKQNLNHGAVYDILQYSR